MKAVFYYDVSEGFSEQNKTVVEPELIENGTRFSYRVKEIPDNCVSIRFEPEREPGTVLIIDRIAADGEVLAAFSDKGEQLGKSFCFFSADRYCVIPIDKTYGSMEIITSITALDPKLEILYYNRLLIDRNNYQLLAEGYGKHYLELQNLNNENRKLVNELQELKAANKNLSVQLEQIRAEKMALQYDFNYTASNYKRLETSFLTIINSKFWKLSYPLRKLLNLIKTWWLKNKTTASSKLPDRNSADPFIVAEKVDEMFRDAARIDIVATEHTMFIASLLRKALKKYDIECCVLSAEPDKYLDIPYIFIAPLFIKKFPELYIVYQMEQAINTRWLSDRYLRVLRDAYAVFDYSISNIYYFDQYPEIYRKIYYMPIDVDRELIVQHPAKKDKKHDVLFYGDLNNSRRAALLDELRRRFDVSIRSNLFGEELYSSICDCKVLVNIHYSDNSLLETTRLYETLSLGNCVIVSEKSRDIEEDNRLKGIVDFVDVGDIGALVERISFWISHDEERENRIRETNEYFMKRSGALDFYFGRFLLANDKTDFDSFYCKESGYIRFSRNRICLNLPESVDRRKEFMADNVYGFEFFPGLKYRLAWIGCAMSYKFIFRKALEQNFEQLIICEDDVFFPPEFSERFKTILKYLDENSDWDVYSGIMSDIGDVEVREVVEKDSEQFVCLNRLISMVFNIYNKSVFELLSSWNENNRDIMTNTIDRYLENTELNIITNYPFLVGHKENLDSTIWKSSNTVYSGMIAESSRKLKELISGKS